jgi:hypothetical protein
MYKRIINYFKSDKFLSDWYSFRLLFGSVEIKNMGNGNINIRCNSKTKRTITLPAYPINTKGLKITNINTGEIIIYPDGKTYL